MLSNTKVLKIKFVDEIYNIEKHGDWYDLRNREDVKMVQGDFKNIPLGICIELPKGFEAIVVPRSSLYIRHGIIMANSIGIIDENYKGDNDEWHLPAICLWHETVIPKHSRLCQFRILEHGPEILFDIKEHLNNQDRGGLGSTGI